MYKQYSGLEIHVYHFIEISTCGPLNAKWAIPYLFHQIHQICTVFAAFDLYGNTFGPRREKTCLRGFARNTGADQPARPRSLISAFVIRFLENVICKLATVEIQFSRLSL